MNMLQVQTIRQTFILITISAFGLVVPLVMGCAQKPTIAEPKIAKSYIVLLPSPDGSVGQVIVKGSKGEHVLTTAGQSGTLDGEAIVTGVDEGQISRDFGSTIAARPLPPVRHLLYFTAGTSLTEESKALISKIVADASKRPAVDVSVIGHTDTVYTSVYNDQLALTRANKVSELLKDNGLKANSLTIESHGKRNLLVATPDNVREPMNRRVEVSLR